MSALAGIPTPMLVGDEMIELARATIDSPMKRALRSLAVAGFRLLTGNEVGEGFQWGFPLSLPNKEARIGRYVYIGSHGLMKCPISIGDFCMLSTHVSFVGDDHLTDVLGTPTRLAFPTSKRRVTVLEADCWIGQGATIKQGVTIGRGSVVAAGSIVTRSVAPYTVVAGVPARVLKDRFSTSELKIHDDSVFGTDNTHFPRN